MKFSPKKYPFAVQNIASNCVVWTGKGTETRTVFPKEAKPDENMCSCVIKMSFGKFTYFSGGDCAGIPEKRNVESAVAEVTGKADVMSMNHHAYIDSANPNFLAKVRPRVMVIQVWDTWHPHINALTRMTDRGIYPDERQIFATGLHSKNIIRLGEAAKNIISPQGHIVIRVTDGGTKYHVFVLNSSDAVPDILFATEEIAASS